MSDQPGRRRLSVRAGNGEDRYARRRSRWEEHIDDVLSNVAAYALAWCEMHAEARSGIDLNDAAAIFTQGLADVRSDYIDTGHIKTDDLGNSLEKKDVFRMHLVGTIDRRAAGRDVRGGF